MRYDHGETGLSREQRPDRSEGAEDGAKESSAKDVRIGELERDLELAQRDLTAAREELTAFQDAADSPLIFVTNAGRRVRAFNRAAARMFGFSEADTGTPLVFRGEEKLTRAVADRIDRVVAGDSAGGLRIRLGRRHFAVRVRGQGEAPQTGTILIAFDDISREVIAKERLRATLDGLPARIALLNRRSEVTMVNRAWVEFGQRAGFSESNAGLGMNYLDVCDRAAAQGVSEAAEVATQLRRVLHGRAERAVFEYSMESPEGTKWYMGAAAPLREPGGRGAVVVHVEITDQVLLHEKMHRQTSALHSTDDAVVIVDAAGRIDWVNRAFVQMLGYAEEELAGKTLEPLRAYESEPDIFRVIEQCRTTGQPWTGETHTRARSGSIYAVRQTVTPIRSTTGELSHFVVITEDVTQGQAAQERLAYLSQHDELTGLWNRKSFTERLEQAIGRASRAGAMVAVLFLDLDRFKDTNEAIGHRGGDQVLMEISNRLRANLRETDALARFGGDEFVIFIEGIADRDSISYVVERIQRSFSRPIEADGGSFTITASMGVTVYPADGATAHELLRNADLAMYRAKAEGRRGFRFFDQRLEAEISERVEIERELNRALGNRDLWIAYQPQCDLETGALTGAESLLRLKPRAGRDIPTGRLIAIAEESGLILPVGQWVVREAIGQLGAWNAAGHSLRMSVNLSAVQFHQQDVFGIITESIKARGVAPSQVKVEITESVLLNRSARVREALHALHGAGIGLVLDDFGTGYSSLSYLQQFPIETVKIDVSFLRGIGKNKNDEAIVAGIIRMAHSLGQSVVAEGVENREQEDFLRRHRCDYAQGFLYAPGLAAAEFEKLLKGRGVSSGA